MTFPARPAAALLALTLLLAPGPAAAQDTPPDPYADGAVATTNACSEPGKNIQCSAFGTISTDTQRDIKGDPVTIDVTIWLNTNYADQGARWLLFSVRNITGESSEPVSISLLKFSTQNGEIVTTRVDHDKPNEIDLWVDVLDTPVNMPITMSVQVGSNERGAYRLEALVLAFDRGYEVLQVGGGEAVLYASTLLGVNKESGSTSDAGGASLLQGKKTPNLVLPGFLAALGIALWLRRRTA